MAAGFEDLTPCTAAGDTQHRSQGSPPKSNSRRRILTPAAVLHLRVQAGRKNLPPCGDAPL